MRCLSIERIVPITGSTLTAHAPMRGVTFTIATDRPPDQYMVGSSIGTSSASATLTGTGALAGSSSGASTTSGALTGVGALAGSSIGTSSSSATLSGPYTVATITGILGSRLHFWYEVGVSTETLNGSNYSQLNDLGPGGYHVTQGTAGNQPSKVVGGGPNGRDCLTLQDTARRITNNAISLSSGRALTFFAVTKTVAAAIGVNAHTRVTDAGTTDAVEDWGNFDSTHFLAAATAHGSAIEVLSITSPALDTGWHVWTQRYAAGVQPVVKCDNAAVSPLYTASSGLCAATEFVQFGHVSAARGSVYLRMCVEDCSAAEETMIRGYITQQTGL